MEEYLSYYGWHFSKKMVDWATSKMYRKVGDHKQDLDTTSMENFKEMLRIYNIKIDCPYEYDCLYVFNMAKSDFFGSSIQDERSLLQYVKDYVEDADGYEGLPFTRFYADSIGSGVAIPWEDVL